MSDLHQNVWTESPPKRNTLFSGIQCIIENTIGRISSIVWDYVDVLERRRALDDDLKDKVTIRSSWIEMVTSSWIIKLALHDETEQMSFIDVESWKDVSTVPKVHTLSKAEWELIFEMMGGDDAKIILFIEKVLKMEKGMYWIWQRDVNADDEVQGFVLFLLDESQATVHLKEGIVKSPRVQIDSVHIDSVHIEGNVPNTHFVRRKLEV